MSGSRIKGSNIQENAEDILAEAREINAQRCREDVFEDESGEEAPEQTSEDLKEDETASADTVTA